MMKFPFCQIQISIHALREEGDSRCIIASGDDRIFLSTPSARRATDAVNIYADRELISIHALREEGDKRTALTCLIIWISIHALREEGDFTAGPIGNARTYFYPRPPRGGRRCLRRK